MRRPRRGRPTSCTCALVDGRDARPGRPCALRIEDWGFCIGDLLRNPQSKILNSKSPISTRRQGCVRSAAGRARLRPGCGAPGKTRGPEGNAGRCPPRRTRLNPGAGVRPSRAQQCAGPPAVPAGSSRTGRTRIRTSGRLTPARRCCDRGTGRAPSDRQRSSRTGRTRCRTRQSRTPAVNAIGRNG